MYCLFRGSVGETFFCADQLPSFSASRSQRQLRQPKRMKIISTFKEYCGRMLGGRMAFFRRVQSRMSSKVGGCSGSLSCCSWAAGLYIFYGGSQFGGWKHHPLTICTQRHDNEMLHAYNSNLFLFFLLRLRLGSRELELCRNRLAKVRVPIHCRLTDSGVRFCPAPTGSQAVEPLSKLRKA